MNVPRKDRARTLRRGKEGDGACDFSPEDNTRTAIGLSTSGDIASLDNHGSENPHPDGIIDTVPEEVRLDATPLSGD